MTPTPSSTSASESADARWPLAFLGSLALFALAEHFLWTNERWLSFLATYSPRGHSDVTRTTGRLGLLRREGGSAVVVLGSSQVVQGVDCRLLEEALEGRPCVNLGINGGSPLDGLFLVDRLGPGQRVTVLGLFPRVLNTKAKRPFINLDTLRCLFETGAYRLLDRDDWRLVLFGELENLSETLRNKDALAHLADALGSNAREAWGGRFPPPSEFLTPEQLSAVPFFMEHVDVAAFSAAQERAVDLLVTRERALGNPVVVVDFPRRAGYEAHVTKAAERRYRALFERLSGVPGVTVLGREQLPAFPDDAFLDMTHLGPEGRDEFSRRLAGAIATLPGRGGRP